MKIDLNNKQKLSIMLYSVGIILISWMMNYEQSIITVILFLIGAAFIAESVFLVLYNKNDKETPFWQQKTLYFMLGLVVITPITMLMCTISKELLFMCAAFAVIMSCIEILVILNKKLIELLDKPKPT